MTWYFNSMPVVDLAALMSCYGADEFASPFRSTIPLLALLKEDHLTTLLSQIGVPADVGLHFEYQVEARKGRGRPSHTDLMVLAGGRRLAIEAKWTEPRYETVLRRFGQEPTDNRRKVIEGWLEYINERIGSNADFTAVGDCVYQMLHRAASACFAAEHPSLAYLVFRMAGEPAKTFYCDDLAALHRALGSPVGFPFYVIHAELKPTAAFEAVRGLRKGLTETGERVKHALVNERLFDFGAITANRIDKGS